MVKPFRLTCPKDEATAKTFVWSSSHSQEKLEKPEKLEPPPLPPSGHRRVNSNIKILDGKYVNNHA